MPNLHRSRPAAWLPPVLLALACALAAPVAAADCPPAGHDRGQLDALRTDGFVLEDDAARQRLALALLACVGDPDPALRDGIAFIGLSRWLRAGQIDGDTRAAMAGDLLGQLQATPDAGGFRQPFAALVLSEVVRADRLDPQLGGEALRGLATAAASYLSGVRDYRGFSETEGWRHGVAHGADLALQLAVHPQLEATQVEPLLAAVAGQVQPRRTLFYTYGEPERLARVAHFAQRRDLFPPEWWQRWLAGLVDPAPLPAWTDAFDSQAGLARRHNLLAFLLALHFAASQAGDAAGDAFAGQVNAALAQVLGG
jgi:hypothetical protein